MPDKKSENPPIVITFTIDPAMKTNTQGQRCMAVSVVARQGDAGQVSRFDMTNWKTDLPAVVYIRGFVQEYARFLGLDARRTADSYLKRVKLQP